jgi:hypothetical protein
LYLLFLLNLKTGNFFGYKFVVFTFLTGFENWEFLGDEPREGAPAKGPLAPITIALAGR